MATRNPFDLPQPPAIPGLNLPQIPNFTGVGMPNIQPVAPITVPQAPGLSPLDPRMLAVPQPPGLSQGNVPAMPQMPTVGNMGKLMENPYAAGIKREIGYGIGRGMGTSIETAMGLKTPKIPQTPEEKAAAAAQLALLTRNDKIANGLIQPKTDKPKADNPYNNYPLTPEGIKAWQSDQGRNISDDLANQLYQVGNLEGGPEKGWASVQSNYAAYAMQDQQNQKTASAIPDPRLGLGGKPWAPDFNFTQPTQGATPYGYDEGNPTTQPLPSSGYTQQASDSIPDPTMAAQQASDAASQQAGTADAVKYVADTWGPAQKDPTAAAQGAAAVWEGAKDIVGKGLEAAGSVIGPLMGGLGTVAIPADIAQVGKSILTGEAKKIAQMDADQLAKYGAEEGLAGKLKLGLGLGVGAAGALLPEGNVFQQMQQGVGKITEPLTLYVRRQFVRDWLLPGAMRGGNVRGPGVDPMISRAWNADITGGITGALNLAAGATGSDAIAQQAQRYGDPEAFAFLDAVWAEYAKRHPYVSEAVDQALGAAYFGGIEKQGAGALVRDVGMAGTKPDDGTPPPPSAPPGTPPEPGTRPPGSVSPDITGGPKPEEPPPGEAPEDILDRITTAKAISDAANNPDSIAITINTRDGKSYKEPKVVYEPDLSKTPLLGTITVNEVIDGKNVPKVIPWDDVQSVTDETGAELWKNQKPIEATPATSEPAQPEQPVDTAAPEVPATPADTTTPGLTPEQQAASDRITQDTQEGAAKSRAEQDALDAFRQSQQAGPQPETATEPKPDDTQFKPGRRIDEPPDLSQIDQMSPPTNRRITDEPIIDQGPRVPTERVVSPDITPEENVRGTKPLEPPTPEPSPETQTFEQKYPNFARAYEDNVRTETSRPGWTSAIREIPKTGQGAGDWQARWDWIQTKLKSMGFQTKVVFDNPDSLRYSYERSTTEETPKGPEPTPPEETVKGPEQTTTEEPAKSSTEIPNFAKYGDEQAISDWLTQIDTNKPAHWVDTGTGYQYTEGLPKVGDTVVDRFRKRTGKIFNFGRDNTEMGIIWNDGSRNNDYLGTGSLIGGDYVIKPGEAPRNESQPPPRPEPTPTGDATKWRLENPTLADKLSQILASMFRNNQLPGLWTISNQDLAPSSGGSWLDRRAYIAYTLSRLGEGTGPNYGFVITRDRFRGGNSIELTIDRKAEANGPKQPPTTGPAGPGPSGPGPTAGPRPEREPPNTGPASPGGQTAGPEQSTAPPRVGDGPGTQPPDRVVVEGERPEDVQKTRDGGQPTQPGSTPSDGRTPPRDSSRGPGNESNGGLGGNTGSDRPPTKVEPPPPTPGTDAASRADTNLEPIQAELDARPPQERLEDNIAAVELMVKIRAEGRRATPEEQAKLTRFSGWGDKRLYGFLFDPETWSTRSQRPIWQRFDAVRKMLTETEQNKLDKSVLNANYTNKPVIDAMWKAMRHLGIESLPQIRVLEPAGGIGRFFGLQPLDLVKRSERAAVEMETLSADMMKQLYPRADIVSKPFQETNLPDNYYDVAISNVPFNEQRIVDRSPKYQESKNRFLTANLHNYFFAKSLDKIRPGGIIGFITSTWTMDAKGAAEFRAYMADNADLLGAFRMPKKSFQDTAVSTDLLFFRKRIPGDPPGNRAWIDTKRYTYDNQTQEFTDASNRMKKDVYDMNPYWQDNPENVLGTWATSLYRGGTIDVEGDMDSTQFAERLNARIAATLPPNVLTPEELGGGTRTRVDPNAVRVPDGSHVVDDKDQVWVQRDGKMVRYEKSNPEIADRVRRMLSIHDSAKEVNDIQINDGSDADLRTAQKKLSNLYWDFVKRHGPLNRQSNRLHFRNDPAWGLLSSIENWDRTTQDAYKEGLLKLTDKTRATDEKFLQTPFFKERLLRVDNSGASVANDPASALALSLNNKGRIDLNFMSESTGLSEQEIISRLGDTIYENPQGTWEPADEYLAGDVRSKLEAARYYALNDERYTRNVEALNKVQPEPVPFSQITVQPSALFVPENILDHFWYDLTLRGSDGVAPSGDVDRLRTRNPRHKYSASTGTWNFDSDQAYVSGSSRALYAVGDAAGEMRVDIPELWKDVMRGKTTKVYDVIGEGKDKQTVLNPELSELAKDRQNTLREEWKKFLYAHPEYMKEIEDAYNTKLNRIRAATYDGSKLKFAGTNKNIEIRPHQASTVWRIIRTGRALVAHEPGFGKTYAMIAAGMELRRLGLSKRNLYVVPRNIVGQWAESFRRLYPDANILFPQGDDYKPENRPAFMNRIKTGNWDAVILSYENFQRINVRPDTLQEYYNGEIRKFRTALAEIGDDNSRRFTKRDIENRLAALEGKLQDAVAKASTSNEKDVFWEDLGIDQLFVDEAHNFKNLEYASMMERVKGLPNTASGRPTDMFIKSQELMKRRGGRGLVMATGSPMTNTIAENWTMQRYLQSDELEKNGLENFDAWAATFGQIEEDLEQQVNGEYKETNRFRYFNQVPELSRIWQLTADVRTSQDDPNIGELKARIRGGNRVQVSAPASDDLKAYMAVIDSRLKNMDPRDRKTDNHLKLASDARKASLDMRLIDPSLPEDPKSKVNMAVNIIKQDYREYTNLKDKNGNPAKGTQVVFLDLGTPKAEELKQEETKPAKDIQVDNNEPDVPDDELTQEEVLFQDSIYKMIRDKLIAKGIPKEEIAFAQEYKTPEKRQKLYSMVRSGDIRVLIGSRKMLAEGVNIQTRLGSVLHLDAPWRPADMQQSEARALRDGNEIFGPTGKFVDGKFVTENEGRGVKIYQFETEESYDGVMWQAVETKARSIMEMMSREPTSRSIVDVDPFVLDMAAARARVAKEPLMLEEKNLGGEIRKRENRLTSDRGAASRAKDSMNYLQGQLLQNDDNLKKIQGDVALREKFRGQTNFEGLDRKLVTDPVAIKNIVKEKVAQAEKNWIERPIKGVGGDQLKSFPIGKFNGFNVKLWTTITSDTLEPGKRFNEKGAPLESYSHNFELSNPDNPTVKYDSTLFPGMDVNEIDVAKRLENTLSNIDRKVSDTQRTRDGIKNDIQEATDRIKGATNQDAAEAAVNNMRSLRGRIRNHLAGVNRFTDEQSQKAIDLIGQYRKGESPTISRDLLASLDPATFQRGLAAMEKFTAADQRFRSPEEQLDAFKNGWIEPDVLAMRGLTPDEVKAASAYLNYRSVSSGEPDPNAAPPVDPNDPNLVSLNMGFDPRPFIKAHPKATVGILAAAAVSAGMQRKEREKRETGAVAEITEIPVVKQILDFGAGGVQVGDVIRGLEEYNDKYLPVSAELAGRVAEVGVSGLARSLGANAYNIKKENSLFDVMQPKGFDGINLSSPNATIKALQDSWEIRKQHNPTLAFLMSLPADPLNWIGWGEGEVAGKELAMSTKSILHPSIVTAEDYEKSINPINRASGHWWSNISRSATSKQISQEFGRIAYAEVSKAGSPVRTLERIDKAMRNGSASIDQARLAHLWGETHEVDGAAVMDLQKKFGIITPTEPSSELIRAISERVRGKSRWDANDIKWLDEKFNFPTRPMSARKIRSMANIQEWAAVHGAPDLSGAIDAADRWTTQEFRDRTIFKARDAFPAKASPLSAWMEQYPLTHAALAMYDSAKPGYQSVSKAIGLPLVLSFLMSPGWTLHATVENLLRGYRGNLAEMPGIIRGKVGTTPWYHDMDGARKMLGHYYAPDLLEGRGGLVQAPFGDNSLSQSKVPVIGGALNKWAADAIRAPLKKPFDPMAAKVEQLKKLQQLRESGNASPEAIKAILSPKPTDAMTRALEGFATVVEKSNLSTAYGLNQWAVGKFEGVMRTYWIAGEHAKVYNEVRNLLGTDAIAADKALTKLLERPQGIDPKVWDRIQSASASVLHKPGALADVVENEIRGTIDRLNLAKRVFLEKDIPYQVQAEWYQAMRHATPEELATMFAKNGPAEQMLNAGLEFQYGNRIQPMIDEIIKSNKFDVTTVKGQKEAWRQLDSQLEASLVSQKDMWKWAKSVGYTMSGPEKDAFYNEVRKIRQNWLSLQKTEQRQARIAFENEIRAKRGIATVPPRVFELQDRAFEELMSAYQKSDGLISGYWAKVAAGGKESDAEWTAMRKAQSKIWDDFRAYRTNIEGEKNDLIEEFYAKNRAGDSTPVPQIPNPGVTGITDAQKAAAARGIENVRADLKAFTERASVGTPQADMLRDWVKKTEDKVAALPEATRATIDDIHARTARIVQDRLRTHFVDHMNTTEVGEFMRNFIPFWMYDASGGVFYLWMAQHMPGFYTDVSRLEQDSGGSGYLTGGMNPVDVPGSPLQSVLPSEDFGIFGNKIGPMRGLWPNRVLAYKNTLERNQPKSVQDFLALQIKQFPTQGLLGMHGSPLLEAPGMMLAGQQPNLPPPMQMATDVSAYGGHGFTLPLVGEVRARDQFLQSNITLELAGKGIDPDTATPEQRRDAEHAVSIRDFAGAAVPRFTYTSPAKLAEQADFQNELARLGYTKDDQAYWRANNISPWSMLDAQQKRVLMTDHPDWQYIFQASDAFKTPEEQVAAEKTRDYLRKNTAITKQKLADQTADDDRLKEKDPTFTPADWMKAHTKRLATIAGRRLQLGIDDGEGKTALEQAALNKVRTPKDQAVQKYYTQYSQSIADNTDGNTINWSEVNRARKEYMQSLPPQIAQYVQEEISRNETDVEKQFYAALDQLDQYNSIPRWVGIPPAIAEQRSKEESTYARMRSVNPAGAAAYRTLHPLLARRLPRNPARDQFVAQNPLLQLWFIPPSTKKMPPGSTDLNLTQFGDPVTADWMETPIGGSAPPPQPGPPGQVPFAAGG